MIVHLRVVPGLGLAVEELRRPGLHSRPVIIGGLPHQRGIVREASLLAQRSGVRAGMSLSQAYHHCPDGTFLVPDLPRYQAVWEELCAVLFSHTPLVEPLALGQAVCDLSGCERCWGSAWEAACRISAEIRRYGIVPWLGVASNRITAELASTVVGSDGITVVEPGQERVFLAGLPIAFLPGIDARMALTFQVLGLRTVGQLADLPASSVKQRFGAAGEQLHRWARGIDRRPVVSPPARLSVSARQECEEGSIEEAMETLRRLAEECADEMQQRRLAGRMIALKLKWGHSFESAPSEGAEDDARPQSHLAQSLSQPQENGSGEVGVPILPIPYRIHSMLPQPGNARAQIIPPEAEWTREVAMEETQDTELSPLSRPEAAAFQALSGPSGRDRVSVVVRTPIESAAPLLERAQRLLVQHWRRDAPRLEAIELEVSEFQPPMQLAFAELNRLDQAGGLRGIDPIRREALLQQEELLTARYGDASFRYLAHVDPSSILTERRFRWGMGLRSGSR